MRKNLLAYMCMIVFMEELFECGHFEYALMYMFTLKYLEISRKDER